MLAQRARPRLIPVLDVMNGHVVRARGGVRENYRPIACPFSGSREPTDVAQAVLKLANANELYIADLDAITEKRSVSRATQNILNQCPVPTWLDAGIGRTDVLDFPETPHLRPVVGFETCHKPEILLETLIEPLRRPVAFSLDLKGGRLLGNWRAWGLDGDRDVMPLARRVIEMGVRALIVLDLARVGTGTGTGTEPLLRAIRNEFPDIDLIAGGGVRTWADVDALGEVGATGVLVASALYDGTLSGHNQSGE
ncbi:1-(5-phosphoribosyl)-5-[(5-phosphoribosylamino)methylideneamino] imidazole-4-carboxamide isomerase [Gemmata sp. SH-PL17]|uniref:HisA/HisF-related TIM barrel protein n=1 Tax=Gemmata sp. SH-PL17 TaxID=1630693 RepID=UPI00078E0F81|nr:HisA/HisF-related TIM barrel protein [Gemmata sp. SH-PL17]AMV24924.1 1-(5-phosphoribosyl)-5-[(5-phosphoribosylamino)methylideneamino] imidazole-4-carboxamide isomerase [Gemmata sp. SH-PL17]